MSNKSSNIKERILQLLEIKHVAKSTFFSQIGMTYGNFTGKSKNTPLNSEAIADIFSIFPDINLEWLITGKGETLCESSSVSKDSTSEVESLKQDIERLKHQVDRLIETNLLLIKNHPATLSAARRVAR